MKLLSTMSYHPFDKPDIAIFGDSFGDGFCCASTGDIIINQRPSHQFHWSNLLAKDLDKKVVNYSSGSSSLYYSMKQFLKHQNNYGTIIFLVTAIGRYTRPVKLENSKQDCFIPNMQNLLAFNNYEVLSPSYQHMLGFFMAQDIEYESFVHHTFIDKILHINAHVILVPCFRGSLSNEICRDHNITFNLWEFFTKVFKNNKLEIPSFNDYIENINLFSGHMLPEMNRVIADNLKHRILTGKWDWKEPDLVLNYKFDDLWRKR